MAYVVFWTPQIKCSSNINLFSVVYKLLESERYQFDSQVQHTVIVP